MRILFLARSLDRGGAERQMVNLARGLSARGHEIAVAVMYAGGAFESELAGAGVAVIDLAKAGRWEILGFVARLVAAIRSWRPQILHPYLLVPNLLATLARRAVPGTRLVWGVRESNLDTQEYGWALRASWRAGRLLSRSADLIIANSHAGRDHYCADGYPSERTVVVPNGIDVERFRRDPEAGAKLRERWGVDSGVPFVGVVSRLDSFKDHETFLRAAQVLSREHPAARFVCAGGDTASLHGRRLQALTHQLGIGDRVLWPGEQSNVVPVYSALDVLVSSSARGEGFSNSIAEGMACELACVVTDVGDSARIVGDTGIVVPPGEPERLGRAIGEALGGARELGAAARRRVDEGFTIDRLVRSTEEQLEKLLVSSLP